ncbi:TetR/AcrR family transcriptional regulator [Ideonella sp. B508-1]|uniref:TetR/AcrR family transcriptional regulator n=1 Tax=Ideonella sp. B508-1 TaxID=137716 RepID=UPI00034CDD89|nr:TetR/AcrR family transcriptional regulator [Ideonella sp. B508-1]
MRGAALRGDRACRPSAQTRQRLLVAAEQVFCCVGVADASLEAVVRAAGLTRGALYWHFADKSALLMALLQSRRLSLESIPLAALHRAPASALAGALIDTIDDPAQRRLCLLLARNATVVEVRQRSQMALFRLQRNIQRVAVDHQAGTAVRVCLLGALAEGLLRPEQFQTARPLLEGWLAQALALG